MPEFRHRSWWEDPGDSSAEALAGRRATSVPPRGRWAHSSALSNRHSFFTTMLGELEEKDFHLYIVHMKRVTASEARKNWFRLLDEVAQGVVVCIERGGRRIVLRREDLEPVGSSLPDYSDLLRVPGVENADRWGWSWSEEDGSLEPEG